MTSYVGTTFYHSTPTSDGLTGGAFAETYYTFALTLSSTSAGDLLFLMASQDGEGGQYAALYPSDPDFGFQTGPSSFASRLCDGSESGGTLHWTVKEITDSSIVGANYIPTYERLFAIVQYTSLAAATVVGQAWTSTAVSVIFLALAAGSILYVVLELVNVNRRLASKTSRRR